MREVPGSIPGKTHFAVLATLACVPFFFSFRGVGVELGCLGWVGWLEVCRVWVDRGCCFERRAGL